MDLLGGLGIACFSYSVCVASIAPPSLQITKWGASLDSRINTAIPLAHWVFTLKLKVLYSLRIEGNGLFVKTARPTAALLFQSTHAAGGTCKTACMLASCRQSVDNLDYIYGCLWYFLVVTKVHESSDECCLKLNFLKSKVRLLCI